MLCPVPAPEGSRERATERAQIEHKRKNIKRVRGGKGTRDEIKEELLAFKDPKVNSLDLSERALERAQRDGLKMKECTCMLRAQESSEGGQSYGGTWVGVPDKIVSKMKERYHNLSGISVQE